MTRATQVRREKIIDEEGNIVELVIWKIPVTQQNPTGIRYRLAFIRKGERQPAVLYDNHHPKGHHRHTEGNVEPYNFAGVDRLLEDFVAEVRRVMGGKGWPRL